ncbi:MAG TPA: enoyl-CoA hydratase/isomerase family protein [Burkholderiaceae bacterium]|nr:enoyl-CoA hydratase/isomerase family protein [Burkholderiaceae bacterium]
MVRVETRGAFVHATLAAPATRNALSDAMVASLGEAITLAEASPATRALVIRGDGGTFCAGGDFGRFRELIAASAPRDAPDPIATFNRGFGALLERLHGCAVATIAVVEGAAMGGGVGLAAACDFVLAGDSARFGMPEVTLGLPPAQIAPFVAQRIGAGAAQRLMLTGRRIVAAQALAVGLIDEALEPGALDARLASLLGELGRAEPAALRATKAILKQRAQAPLAATLDTAAQLFAAALCSGTADEGIAAFAAKRAAAWVVSPDAAAGGSTR